MVSPVNSAQSLENYASSINYNDAKSHIDDEKGITQEVFVRYVRTEFGDVAAKDAGALFEAIDKNGSGGLREAEFNRWAFAPAAGASSGRRASSVDSTSNASAVNRNVSSNDVNASFGGYKKLTRVDGGTDRFNNVKSDYLIIVESHGRNASSKVSANQLPKVSGATLVSYGGSHDKYIALYKVTDSTVSITGDGGSGQALFINTDKKVSLSAKAVDPSLGGEKLKGPAKSNQLVIYADDEGGKGNKTNGVADRDRFFKSNSKTSFGGGDDLIYIVGNQVSPNNNKGPTLNGASGVLTFS